MRLDWSLSTHSAKGPRWPQWLQNSSFQWANSQLTLVSTNCLIGNCYGLGTVKVSLRCIHSTDRWKWVSKVLNLPWLIWKWIGSEIMHLTSDQELQCESMEMSNTRVLCSAPSVPQPVFTITEKAPTRAFSWLRAPTSAFTFQTHWVCDAIIIKDGRL